MSIFYALKALAKTNANLFAIAFKSEKERKLDNFRERAIKRSKELIPKRIKSDNFTRSNREKFNIAIANIGKINDWMATYLFRIFGGSNNISVYCTVFMFCNDLGSLSMQRNI